MSENDNLNSKEMQTGNKEVEINVRKLLVVLFRNLHWLALAAVICGAALWAYSTYAMKPMYTSTATIYTHNTAVNAPGSQRQTVAYTELYAAEQLSGPYIAILMSEKLLAKTIDALHLNDTPAMLRRGLSVTTDDKLVITVSMTRDDPAEAQKILSQLLRFYPAEIDRVIHSGGSEVINEASLPTRPSSPNVMRNTLLGAFVGLFLAAAYFVIHSIANDVVTDEEELVSDFGLPVLGVIPQIEQQGKELKKHEKHETK